MTAAAIPYVTLLGQSSDSDAVRALLDRGDAGPPVLERGDVKAWLDLTSLGIGLVFADEAFLTRDETLAIGEGSLILTSIRFVAKPSNDFEPFTGPLPMGVSFSDSRADIRKTLGAPEWESDPLRKDRWRIDGTLYFANYTPSLDRLISFSAQVPDPQ